MAPPKIAAVADALTATNCDAAIVNATVVNRFNLVEFIIKIIP